MRILIALAAAATLAAVPATAGADVAGPPDPKGYTDCYYAAAGQPCVKWCRIYDVRDSWHPCGVENLPAARID